MKKQNLIEKRFGKLLVLRQNGRKGTAPLWLCKCDCGKEKDILSYNLLSGGCKSCGCSEGQSKLPKGQSMFNALYLQYGFNARKRELNFNISKEDFRKITKSNCFYCDSKPKSVLFRKQKDGRKPNGKYVYNGLDRINSSKDYIENNVVPCCKVCNIMKQSLSKEEFIKHINRITVNLNKKEIEK